MKKKIVSLLLVLLLSLALLCSCGSPRTALSASQFINKMEANGYTVQDGIEQAAENPAIESLQIAIKDDIQIEYYSFESKAAAVQFFNINKEIIATYKGNVSTEKSISLNNYSVYVLQSGGYYSLVCRIDDTAVYVQVKESDKEETMAILEEIGYQS